MKTLSICTTPDAARRLLATLPTQTGEHTVVLAQEAVICTPESLGATAADIRVSAEDAKARGGNDAWSGIEAIELIRMIEAGAKVRVL